MAAIEMGIKEMAAKMKALTLSTPVKKKSRPIRKPDYSSPPPWGSKEFGRRKKKSKLSKLPKFKTWLLWKQQSWGKTLLAMNKIKRKFSELDKIEKESTS